ncbi:MAG: hypothetical protein IPK03_17615 [Bacteroidetes bacterium]|nr:hypothetical protein [Bacteroidota bacterium]
MTSHGEKPRRGAKIGAKIGAKDFSPLFLRIGAKFFAAPYGRNARRHIWAKDSPPHMGEIIRRTKWAKNFSPLWGGDGFKWPVFMLFFTEWICVWTEWMVDWFFFYFWPYGRKIFRPYGATMGLNGPYLCCFSLNGSAYGPNGWSTGFSLILGIWAKIFRPYGATMGLNGPYLCCFSLN